MSEAPAKSLLRPVTITVASIIFAVFGFLELLAGVGVATIAGLLAEASSTEAAARLVLGILGGLAVLIILIGLVDFAIGYGLWNMKRWSAILGMLSSIFGIIIQSAFDQIFRTSLGYGYYGGPSESIPTYIFASSISSASLWVNILIFALIAISWKAFESP